MSMDRMVILMKTKNWYWLIKSLYFF